MAAGYSGTPLVRKLGYKEGFRVAVLAAPPEYLDWVGEMPEGVRIARALRRNDYDLIHFFVRRQSLLELRFDACRDALNPAGMLWVSWPKRASGVETDVTEDTIRDLALERGLVDTKVAAVDDTWSALKLVRRLTDR